MDCTDAQIESRCRLLARLLTESGRRLVLAESCTAGLVAAFLARIPGISNNLCGSMVTYRNATKWKWLGVPEAVLTRHTAVSEPVGRLMVIGALAKTPEADLAASVTGHLGPNAPPDQDGLVYIGVAKRCLPDAVADVVTVHEYRLTGQDRLARQREAVCLVLNLLIETLDRLGC